jgi:D-threo-aldose 1-dehydrogenase
MTDASTLMQSRRVLGRTGLSVSPICLGTAGWASASTKTYFPSPEESAATFDASIEAGINYLDTSNNYGGGESEVRLGRIIAERGGLPEGFVLQTKLDRDMTTDDFSAARMRTSLEESLTRLGLDRLPLLFLHDPENADFAQITEPGGPLDFLVDLKREGVVGAIGVAGGRIDYLIDLLDLDVMDAVITHNRFTLVDRSAEPLIDRARELGVGVVNGAPFGGGLLAAHPRTTSRYHYHEANAAVVAAADSIGALLDSQGIPIAAAAVQLSVRDPRIDATLTGLLTPAHVADLERLLDHEIAPSVWEELDSLLPDPEHWIPWPLPER